jgi:hypothetical protein
MLDVPGELIWSVSRLLAARRREIGTRKGTRRLGCYKQALFALAWFRDKGDIPRLGRGFGLRRRSPPSTCRPSIRPNGPCRTPSIRPNGPCRTPFSACLSRGLTALPRPTPSASTSPFTATPKAKL